MSISFLSVISNVKSPNPVKPQMHQWHKNTRGNEKWLSFSSDPKLKISTEKNLLTEHKFLPKLFSTGWLLNYKKIYFLCEINHFIELHKINHVFQERIPGFLLFSWGVFSSLGLSGQRVWKSKGDIFKDRPGPRFKVAKCRTTSLNTPILVSAKLTWVVLPVDTHIFDWSK